MASGGELVAVTVDCNLFRGKTHVNPISRLLEPIANAIEHGRADRVDAVVERLQGQLVFTVTEHGGAGMTALDCEEAIRFGHHAAKDDAKTLHNYSHNGIGTKACLNFFSKLAIFSVVSDQRAGTGQTYVLLLLDVADKNGDGHCQPAKRLTWTVESKAKQPTWTTVENSSIDQPSLVDRVCQQLNYLAPETRNLAGVGSEFAKIGASGTRMVYFDNEGREGTSEASKQFILDGQDVRVHPAALTASASMSGGRDNTCPLYVTSLRQRLRHFLAKPSANLYLNNMKVKSAGSDALYACMDEKIEPFVDVTGLLGEAGATVDPSNLEFDCGGFKAVLKMGKSDRNCGHRRWGTELFGDHFGSTQDGGCVVWVNGALVPLGEGLWKHGISFQGKRMRWTKAQGGTKWGMHIWGVVEMYPPADETILDIGKERLMPTEGGKGTRQFLQKLGPVIDYVLGVAYFRDTKISTNVKQLKSGTCTLTGQRPAVFEDALGWMDSNMAAACKATVRAEKKRAAQTPKPGVASGAGKQQDTNGGNSSGPTPALELSGSGRHRKAPERLNPNSFAAHSQHSKTGTRRKPASAKMQTAAFKAEKLRWKAEREMRERTRQLLLQELWKSVAQPEEGPSLVGWMVETSGVDDDEDELASGAIVKYSPPDTYTVKWTDATTTDFAFSDLFSPGVIPLVLPLDPTKVDLSAQANFKPKKATVRKVGRPKNATVKKLNAPTASKTPAQQASIRGKLPSLSDGSAAAVAYDQSTSAARTQLYSQAERVSVLFTMQDGSTKQWFDGQVVFQQGTEGSHRFTILFDDGDELDIDGSSWTFNDEAWYTQQLIKRLEDSHLGRAGDVNDMSKVGSNARDHPQGDESKESNEEEIEALKVEKIIRSRFNKKRKSVEYSVRWSGYGPSDDTWEPLENLGDENTQDVLLAEFKSRQRPGTCDSNETQMASGSGEQKAVEKPAAPRRQNPPWSKQELQRLEHMIAEDGHGDWKTKASKVNAEFHLGGTVRSHDSVRSAYSTYFKNKKKSLSTDSGATKEARTAELKRKTSALPSAVAEAQSQRPQKKKKKQKSTCATHEKVHSSPILAVLGKRWKHPLPAKPGTYSTKPPLVRQRGGGMDSCMLKIGAVLQYLVQRGSGDKQVANVGHSVADDAADPSTGLRWEDAQSLNVTNEPGIINYERQIADDGGLSAGTELLTVRYLSFAAPMPPSFEYICCNELVGAAVSWTPNGKYLIKQGRDGAEQVRSLQHALDRRGRAYDEVTGRLRFARDVIYEMPSTIPNSSAHDRVVTNGRYKPLEVFHTGDSRGFGVWSPEKIYEGDFICEYVGEILTVDEAVTRSDHSYQFELAIVSKPLGVENLSLSPTKRQRLGEGEQQQSHAHDQDQENVWPEAEYMVDARRKGNVARFINHSSSSPNLFPQMVFCAGHIDPKMPAIALFANQDIKPFTELYFDYGPQREDALSNV